MKLHRSANNRDGVNGIGLTIVLDWNRPVRYSGEPHLQSPLSLGSANALQTEKKCHEDVSRSCDNRVVRDNCPCECLSAARNFNSGCSSQYFPCPIEHGCGHRIAFRGFASNTPPARKRGRHAAWYSLNQPCTTKFQ